MVNYDKKMDELVARLDKLTGKSKLDLDTALFFENEIVKLEHIIDNHSSSKEEIVDALNKLRVIQKRIQFEANYVYSDVEKLEQIKSELDLLDKAIKNEKRS